MGKPLQTIIPLAVCLTLLVAGIITIIPTGEATPISLDTVAASFLGASTDKNTGSGCHILGDIDGDGYDDMAITSWLSNTSGVYTGRIWIIYGGAGKTWSQGDSLAAEADAIFWGHETAMLLGASISSGDVNGDGYMDMVVGAYLTDDAGDADVGRVYIKLGSSTRWTSGAINTIAAKRIVGNETDQKIGSSVDASGDINGDGMDDIIVGASEAESTKGMAWVFLGRPGWPSVQYVSDADAMFQGVGVNDKAGYSVSIIGDVNADGYDEFCIGAPFRNTNKGTQYMFFGRETLPWTGITLVSAAEVRFAPTGGNALAGFTSSGVGDINGDGFDDLVCTCHQYTVSSAKEGKAFIFFGHDGTWPTTLSEGDEDASIIGTNNYDFLGIGIIWAGDMDGDQIDDLVISAPYRDSGSIDKGMTYIIKGKRTGWTLGMTLPGNASKVYVGVNTGERSGSPIGSGGDMDRDGLPDLLISARDDQTMGEDGGRVYLIYPFINDPPTSPSEIKAFEDPAFTAGQTNFDIGDTVYIEMGNNDANPGTIDNARVDVQLDGYNPHKIRVLLRETESDSGLFRGNFTITNFTHQSHRWVKGEYGGTITINSWDLPAVDETINIFNKAKIEECILNDVQGSNDSIMYAHGKPVTFEILINNTGPVAELTNITIVLNGPGEAEFRLIPQTEEFTQIRGHEYLIMPDGESEMDVDLYGRMQVDLVVYPTWEYPDEELHGVEISVKGGATQTPLSVVVNDIFQVENDLITSGDLVVDGDINWIIPDDGWTAGTETLNWSGPQVFYEGTDFAPEVGTYRVKLDNGVDNWTYTPDDGGRFYFDTTNNNISATDVTYTITAIDIPSACDKIDLQHTINVDAGLPKFSHLTEPSGWSNATEETVSLWITDDDIGIINTTMVDYAIKPDGGSWGLWTGVTPTFHTTYYRAEATAAFDEGINQVRFRCVDLVNPTYNFSDPMTVRIDRTPVVFSDVTPTTTCETGSVMATINISDALSGVKSSTIEYSYRVGTDNWLSWVTPTNLTYDAGVWYAQVHLTLSPGSTNTIRWRAYDNASNLAVSDEYTIAVEAIPEFFYPNVGLIFPADESSGDVRRPVFTWELLNADKFEGFNVTYDVYLGTNENLVTNHDSSVLVANDVIALTYTPPLDLTPDETYYWTVVPFNGTDEGSCTSDVFSFYVEDDFIPSRWSVELSFDLDFSPSIKFKAGEDLTFNLTIRNTGNMENDFDLSYTGDLTLEFSQNPVTIAAGASTTIQVTIKTDGSDDATTYVIEITATGQGGPSPTDSKTITPTLEKSSSSSDDNSMLIIAAVVIAFILLVIVIVAIIFIVTRGKKKEEPKPEPEVKPTSEPKQDMPEPYSDPYAGVRSGDMEATPAEAVSEVEITSSDIFAEKKFHDGYSMGKSSTIDITPGPVVDLGELLQNIKDAGANQQYLALPPATVISQQKTDLTKMIEELFIINKDGILLKHFAMQSRSSVDKDILASMLTALHSLFNDSFDGIEGTLDEVKYGKFNIIMTQGQMVNLITLVTTEETAILKQATHEFVEKLELEKGAQLNAWDGDVDELVFLDGYIEQLMGQEKAELEGWEDNDGVGKDITGIEGMEPRQELPPHE